MGGLGAAFGRTPGQEAVPLRVDPGDVWVSRFRGWGTSLAWWARVAGEFPDEIRHELMRQVFDRGQGLGLNIVRYNIGGGENPEHEFLSYRAAVEGYQAREGQWRWEVDRGQRRVLHECRKFGVDTIEAFSNSPPWWMTKSGSVTGDRDGRGNLRDEMIGPFADYLATVVRHFRDKAGVEFQALAPLNEPLGFWWKLGNKQEGCVIPPGQQSKLIVATREALDRHGLRTLVTGPEDNRTSHAVKSLEEYSGAAWKALGHVNTHTYHVDDRGGLAQLANKRGKEIWVSEYGDGDASGAKLAARIISDMRDLRPSAWIYWQAADARGWGLVAHPACDHDSKPPTPGEVRGAKLNPKFHVMRQFSVRIPPGSRIVASSLPESVAAYDPVSRQLGVVVSNPADDGRSFEMELPGGWLRGKTLVATLVPVGGEPKELPPLICEGEKQDFTLPGKSLLGLTVKAG